MLLVPTLKIHTINSKMFNWQFGRMDYEYIGYSTVFEKDVVNRFDTLEGNGIWFMT